MAILDRTWERGGAISCIYSATSWLWHMSLLIRYPSAKDSVFSDILELKDLAILWFDSFLSNKIARDCSMTIHVSPVHVADIDINFFNEAGHKQ